MRKRILSASDLGNPNWPAEVTCPSLGPILGGHMPTSLGDVANPDALHNGYQSAMRVDELPQYSVAWTLRFPNMMLDKGRPQRAHPVRFMYMHHFTLPPSTKPCTKHVKLAAIPHGLYWRLPWHQALCASCWLHHFSASICFHSSELNFFMTSLVYLKSKLEKQRHDGAFMSQGGKCTRDLSLPTS